MVSFKDLGGGEEEEEEKEEEEERLTVMTAINRLHHVN